MFVLPEYLLSNIYCHIKEIIIVREETVKGIYIEDTRFEKVRLDKDGNNITIPFDKNTPQDYYFKIHLKHFGGYEYVTERMMLSIGCTSSIKFT